LAPGLAGRQITERVDRLTVQPDFKMDGGFLAGTGAHLRDFLPASDPIALPDGELAVIAIGAKKRIIVLDDNKLPIAYKSTSAIHDLASGSGPDRLSLTPADIHALSAQVAFAEA
jgi:hypothetical protein